MSLIYLPVTQGGRSHHYFHGTVEEFETQNVGDLPNVPDDGQGQGFNSGSLSPQASHLTMQSVQRWPLSFNINSEKMKNIKKNIQGEDIHK